MFDGEGEGTGGGTGDPWYKGASDVVVGVLQQRGIADKPPADVLANLVEAHANAEKLIGAPANELVRWPKSSDDPNWAPLKARLGVPAEAKDYDFSKIVGEDGKPLVGDKLAEALRPALHRVNVGAEAATEIAKAIVGYNAEQSRSAAAETTAKRAAEQEALKTSWGANYEANRVAALGVLSRMLEASGMAKEDAATAINTLEATAGGSKVMEMFRAFSTMSREDNFVRSEQPGGGVVSYQEAVATKQALMRDDAWVSKWNSGDINAIKQLDALERVIVANKPESDEATFNRQLAEQYGRR